MVADNYFDKNSTRKKKTSLQKELSEFIGTQPQNVYSKSLRLHQAWEDTASEQELKHTDNIVRSKNREYMILIYVDSSHWAAELSTKRELYRIMLENGLNEEIHELKFLVSRKVSLKKVFQRKRKENSDDKNKYSSIKLSKDEDRDARQMVSQITNEELQTRLYKAIKADFEWKKGQGNLKLSQNTPQSPESI